MNPTVAQVLEAVSDRSAIEPYFHDVNEIHGASEQQLRYYWVNVAASQLTLWWHIFIELWTKPEEELIDRRDRPQGFPNRRPSYTDRRNALRRLCLESEFQREAAGAGLNPKIRRFWTRVLDFAE